MTEKKTENTAEDDAPRVALTTDAYMDHVKAPPQVEWHPIPQWGPGVGVYVRSASGMARDAYEVRYQAWKEKGDSLANWRATLVVACLCAEDGRLLFGPKDIKRVSMWTDGALIDELFDHAREMSGLTTEEVKEIEGNSSDIQSESSTSG